MTAATLKRKSTKKKPIARTRVRVPAATLTIDLFKVVDRIVELERRMDAAETEIADNFEDVCNHTPKAVPGGLEIIAFCEDIGEESVFNVPTVGLSSLSEPSPQCSHVIPCEHEHG